MTAGLSVSGPDLVWRPDFDLRCLGFDSPRVHLVRGVGRAVECIRLISGQRLSRSRVRIPHSPPHFSINPQPAGLFFVFGGENRFEKATATAKNRFLVSRKK